MRFGKTAFLHFGTQIGLSLAGFFGTFVIARVLGPSVLGMYVTTVGLLFWLKVPTDGIATAVTKRVSEGPEGTDFVSAGFLLNAAFAFGVSLLALSGSGYVNDYVGASVTELFVVVFLSNVVFDTVAASLQGQQQIVEEGVIRVVERVGRVVVQVVLIFASYELFGLLVGHSLSLIVMASVGLWVLQGNLSVPSQTSFRRLLEYGQYSWLGSLRGRMFGWMDTLVLAFFVSSTLVGIYEVAWTLSSTLILVGRSVRKTLFPELSNLSTDDRYDRIHHFLSEAFVFTGIFAIPGLFGAILIGPEVLKIYRPEFVRGGTVLLILIVARLNGAFGSQLRSAINAIDRPDIAFRINLVFVLSNFVLNVGLVYFFGWHGAAVATLVSATVSLVLSYWYLTRLIGRPSIPFTEFGWQVVASTGMCVVLLFIKPLMPTNHFITVGLVLLAAAVYTMLLVAISSRIRGKARLLVSQIGV